jgi:DMSO/TMAO reductase YedYZ molybdopterin-dependent catalytic subunit
MHRLPLLLSFLTIAAAAVPARAEAQPAPAAVTVAPPTALAVAGAVKTPLSLSAADLRTMPRTTVQVKDDSRTVTYEGVLVGEILKRAGVPMGEALRGDWVASYVVAHAADGYRAVYALAELDNAFVKSDVLVADTMDGKPLFAYQGPWRLVAPNDQRGARSVRLLDRLEVVRLPR